MAGGEDRPVQPGAWWGSILASARQRATTQEIWGAIREYADQQGLDLPPNLFQEVNRMRSTAVGLRASADALNAARPDQAITNRMVGQQIYARGDQDRSLAPLYHVRFQMTTSLGGQESTDWYTMEYAGQLPDTVGQLLDDVSDIGQGLTTGYGLEFVGVGDVEIGEW